MRPTGYFPRAKKRLRANGQMLLMCALPLLKIFVFSYLPMIGIVLAFKNYQPRLGIFGSPWVGLKNFEFFFTSKDAFRVLRNTVGMSVLNLAVCTFANVSVALMLYEVSRKRLLKFYQTVLFIPYFLSWVMVGLMLTVFLNQRDGLLTAFVYQLTGQRMDFYAAPGPGSPFSPPSASGRAWGSTASSITASSCPLTPSFSRRPKSTAPPGSSRFAASPFPFSGPCSASC